MKKILIGTSLFMACIFFSPATEAQVRVNVNVNIGSQPQWGPSGYDYAEYYYLPDIEMYYYVPSRQFIYLSGGNWVFATTLPARYRSYNLYTGYKVVVNEPKAYNYYHSHKIKYAKYKGNHSQVVIKNHKSPGKYKSKPGNGHGKGHKHGKGHH